MANSFATFINSLLAIIRQFPREVWKGNYFLSAKFAYFVKELSAGAYIHFLNVYLKDVGLNTIEVGFIAGLTYAGMSLSSPLFGLLIDHTGRRRLIYSIFALSISTGVLAMPFVARITNHHSPFIGPTRAPNSTASLSTTVLSTLTDATVFPTTVVPTKSFSSNTFFAMLVLDVAAKCVGCVLPSMMDAAVMNILERKPSCKYGGSRVWGSIGFGVGAVFAGSVTDKFAEFFKRNGLSKYTAAFSLAAIVQVISLPLVLYVISKMTIGTETSCDDIKSTKMENGHSTNAIDENTSVEHERSGNAIENANSGVSKFSLMIKTFLVLDNFMFVLTVIIGGVSLMSLTGFLFIFMDKMNASDTMKGAAVQVQSWVQVLIFPFSDMIIKKLGGTVVALEIGLLSFCIRFICDSYIRSSGLFLCTQLLHAFGYALFWAAVVAHTQIIAPAEIYVTIFSVISGLYYGFGGLLGNMLGGVIYRQFSGEVLFLSMGIVSGVWVVITALYFHGGKWIGRKRGNVNKVEPMN